MGNLLRCHGDAQGRRGSTDGGPDSATIAAKAVIDVAAAKAVVDAATAKADRSYAEKAHIDDEVLVVRYLHLMHPATIGGCGGSVDVGGVSQRRGHVSFRAESFDSQSSTTSERREFVIDLVDSLPETFVDDALPPASARGRLGSWSSVSSDSAAAAAGPSNGVMECVEVPSSNIWDTNGETTRATQIPSAS